MDKSYQNRLCLFLDILGFSDLVRKEQCNTVHRVISKIKDELKSNKDYMSKIGNEPIATTFSDCIVLSLEADTDNIEEAANILVSATVRMLQDTFINQKIALRGGIAYGKLYHMQDGVFGPAMNKAYELESQFAVWPRVIFDKSVIQHFNGNKTLASIGYTNYGDGFCGVDCLNRIDNILCAETNNLLSTEQAATQLENLSKIDSIIDGKLAEHYGNPKVYSKYLKLHERTYSVRKKHGQVVLTFEELDG